MIFKSSHLFLCKCVVLLLWHMAVVHPAMSQEMLWSKSIESNGYKIVDVFFEDSTETVLVSGDSSSNVLVLDSAFNDPFDTQYNRSFSSVINLDSSRFVSYTENGFSGVHRLDSIGQIEASVLLTSGPADHPQLFKWHNNQMLLVDNYDYINGAIYPRITRLSSDLIIDTSFFLPQDFVLHLYADAVVNDRKELLITGVKAKLQQETELDQMFIRMDSTLDFEVAKAFGTSMDDWVGVGHQGIASFPSGGLICGQTTNGTDTNVTLSVVGFDGVPISNHVFDFVNPAHVSNESVVYANSTESVYCIIYTAQASYLIVTNLDGDIQDEFVFNNEMYRSIYLNNNKIYLASNEGVLCLDLFLSGLSAEGCTLVGSSDNAQLDSSSWGVGNYFVQKFGIEDNIGTTSTLITSGDIQWETRCPQVSIEGDMESCKGDSVLLVAVGDRGFSWREVGQIESSVVFADSLWLIVDAGVTYEVKGFHGNQVEVKFIESDDPECVLDTIPVVYDYVSPNGDNENEYFFIKNIEYYQPVSVTVVNAQNQLLFRDEDYQNDWSPSELSLGTYFYSVESNSFKKSGNLMINR